MVEVGGSSAAVSTVWRPYSARDTTSLKGCNGTAHGKCKAIITRFRARSIGLADIYTPYPAIITALVPRNAVTLRFIERYFAWRWMCTRATQAMRVCIYIYMYISSIATLRLFRLCRFYCPSVEKRNLADYIDLIKWITGELARSYGGWAQRNFFVLRFCNSIKMGCFLRN